MTAHHETLIATDGRAKKGYLSSAFLVQYNLILLFGAALFALAAASFVPLAVGLALELAWLGAAPNLPVFRRWVDRRAAAPSAAAAPEPDFHGLEPGYASRLFALRGMLRDIGARIGAPPDSELGHALDKLPSLESRFVALCQGAQRLSRFLDETPQAALEQEIARLNAAFSAETDLGVRMTIRQAINLAQRRRNQRERVVSTRRAIEVELETVESSLSYLHAQALAIGPSIELVREIGALFDQLNAPAALEADLADALGPQTPAASQRRS